MEIENEELVIELVVNPPQVVEVEMVVEQEINLNITGQLNNLNTNNKSNLVAAVNEVNEKASSGGILTVKNETPLGELNGSNATFISEFNFIPESLEVFVNGMKMKLINDYINTDNHTFQLKFSPESGEHILINYTRV